MVAVTSLLLATACAQGSSGGSASGGGGRSDLTIGMVSTETGVLSQSGSGNQGILNNSEVTVAADQINAHGGVKVDGKTYNLQFKILNDNSNPQTAISDVVQLVRDDHVSVIYGPLGTNSLAAAPLLAQSHVIDISQASTIAPLIGNPKYPLLFDVGQSPTSLGTSMVAALHRFEPDAKTVAVFTDLDPQSQSFVPVISTVGSTLGLTATDYEYPATTIDLGTIANQIVAAKPDAVMLMDTAAADVNELQSLKNAGLPSNIPIASYEGPTNFQDQETPNCSIQFFGQPLMDLQDLTPLESTYHEADVKAAATVGEQLGISGVLTPTGAAQFPKYYNSVPLVVKAMEKAGTTTNATAIAKALNEVSYNGIGGKDTHFVNNSLRLGQADLYYCNGTAEALNQSPDGAQAVSPWQST